MFPREKLLSSYHIQQWNTCVLVSYAIAVNALCGDRLPAWEALLAYAAETGLLLLPDEVGRPSHGGREYDSHFHNMIRSRAVTGYQAILALHFGARDSYFAKARPLLEIETVSSLTSFDLKRAQKILKTEMALLLATYANGDGFHSVVVGADSKGLYFRDPALNYVTPIRTIKALGTLRDGMFLRPAVGL